MKEENEKNKISKKMILSIIFVLVLIIIDQSCKIYVLKNDMDNKTIIDDTVEIDYVENKGGAFGIGQGNTLTFIITNIVVLGLILRFIYLQREEMDTKTLIMLLLILAGGISNVIDRVSLGFVVDYINLFPKINFLRINIADIYICIGWITFVFTIAVRTVKDFRELKKKDKDRGVE